MIIADENIEQFIIDELRKHYEVFSICEHAAGASDKEVIQITLSKKGILITEDKDFGELVFAHKLDKQTIILIRPDKTDQSDVLHNLLTAIKKVRFSPKRCFVVISKKKIRIREI